MFRSPTHLISLILQFLKNVRDLPQDLQTRKKMWVVCQVKKTACYIYFYFHFWCFFFHNFLCFHLFFSLCSFLSLSFIFHFFLFYFLPVVPVCRNKKVDASRFRFVKVSKSFHCIKRQSLFLKLLLASSWLEWKQTHVGQHTTGVCRKKNREERKKETVREGN